MGKEKKKKGACTGVLTLAAPGIFNTIRVSPGPVWNFLIGHLLLPEATAPHRYRVLLMSQYL